MNDEHVNRMEKTIKRYNYLKHEISVINTLLDKKGLVITNYNNGSIDINKHGLQDLIELTLMNLKVKLKKELDEL